MLARVIGPFPHEMPGTPIALVESHGQIESELWVPRTTWKNGAS